ncbi:MAG: hypothetical protein E6I13_14110 [Chloroflexi bacterium]|nr:MAG: hypothetical protein E6I13_14110 [Chloroflexota bacterium]
MLVCPDVDAVIYRLAGIFNDKAGYGIKEDTFAVLESLAKAGEDTWFRQRTCCAAICYAQGRP